MSEMQAAFLFGANPELDQRLDADRVGPVSHIEKFERFFHIALLCLNAAHGIEGDGSQLQIIG